VRFIGKEPMLLQEGFRQQRRRIADGKGEELDARPSR